MENESNMKISVSDYGPIAEAKDIELCPLTVFVGPSNTGKSYLAVLIYALFKSLVSLFPLEQRGLRETDISGKIEELLKMIGKADELSNPEETVNNNFHDELSRCMGIPRKALMGGDFILEFKNKQKNLTLELSNATCNLQINDSALAKAGAMTLDTLSSLNKISESGVKSFYLPAARTGIMQSHQAIAASLVQQAATAGLRPISVPTLNGIISDFLKGIIYMDTRANPDPNVGKVTNEMEENILHGSIESENSAANYYPQFLYRRQNCPEVPLSASSSMVTELAPIILFLRYHVKKGNLLIIEEPEAHLHPEAQRKTAETVVRLVRAGVQVMVTTHSDYFLDQLANHVRLSYLPKGEQGVVLEEGEIGAYAFKPQTKGGTIVERLRFDRETGLSPEDHNKVSSDLYNETVEILDQLDNTE